MVTQWTEKGVSWSSKDGAELLAHGVIRLPCQCNREKKCEFSGKTGIAGRDGGSTGERARVRQGMESEENWLARSCAGSGRRTQSG